MYNYTCLSCQNQFSSYNKNRKYCSIYCSHNAPREMPVLKCLLCKVDFVFKRLDRPNNPSKYCSKSCRLNYERSIDFLRDNYLKHVIKNTEGCWGWHGTTVIRGYGRLSYKDRPISAHRASWIIHKGSIPKGMFVCHVCDNPPCTNPDHLFIGTAQDNSLDMINKKRNKPNRGSKCPQSKLKEEDVLAIRQMINEGKKQRDIAIIFSVNEKTISKIKHKIRWSHI